MSAEKKNAGKPDSGKKGTIKIKQVVSFIGSTDDIRQAVRGLGLRRMHHSRRARRHAVESAA